MDVRGTRLFALVIGIFVASSLEGFSGDTYESPNFLNEIESLNGIGEENQVLADRVAHNLVMYAVNLGGDPEAQAKAIAVAWNSNKKSRALVIEADFYLRLGEFPSDHPSFAGAPSAENLSKATEKLFSYSTRLGGVIGRPEKSLAAFTLDLLQSGKVASGVRKSAKSSLILMTQPSWTGVIGAGEESEGSVSMKGAKGGAKFIQRQSLIKGLLVVDLGSSDYAGQASQMNATLVEGTSSGAVTEILFNQSVGDSMSSALEEVRKYITVRHGDLPNGKRVEIAFEEQYSSKDGPSAAVACTLLIDSLMTGDKFDPAFAVTGDMNADGSVQPVGGIDGKIRGATKRDCTHVAIPRQNVGLLSDMLVVNDLRPLIAIQVFSIGKFDEALALAKDPASRDPKLQKAITTFAEVQKVLLRPNGQKLLTNSHVRGRLQAVLTAAPNHESARLLLLKSTGKVPSQLSLRGSFSQIDKVTKPIMAVLETGKLDNSAKGLKDSVFALRRVRRKLDDRAKPTADALEDLSESLEALEATKLGGRSERVQVLLRDFKIALSRVQTEYNKLAANPDIQEELIK